MKEHLETHADLEQAGQIFEQWAQLPIGHAEYMEKLVALQKKYFPTTKPLPGAHELVKALSSTSNPKIELALATSSHKNNYLLKTNHLQNLFSLFPEETKVLGDDPRIPKGRGKPAPDIYLLALKTINESRREQGFDSEIKPEECLVLEDSVPGVESGRRAGMQVVWCPHPGLLEQYGGREKEVLAGLTGEHKDEIPPVVTASEQKPAGTPGQIDDGWGILLKTLEDFPYEKYGIRIQDQ